MVLQDAQGIFRVTFSKKFHDYTNNGIELKALLIRVKLFKQLGFRHAITETNSELVVEWIMKQSCSAWYLWDYWDGLQVKFQGIEFMINHTFREGNQIVDFLSKNGECGMTYKYMHFDELPKEVHVMLCLDKLGLPNWQL